MSELSTGDLKALGNKELVLLAEVIHGKLGFEQLCQVKNVVEAAYKAFKEITPDKLAQLLPQHRKDYRDIRDDYFKLLDDVAIYATENMRALGDLKQSKTREELRKICKRLENVEGKELQGRCGELRTRITNFKPVLESMNGSTWQYWLGALVVCVAVVGVVVVASQYGDFSLASNSLANKVKDAAVLGGIVAAWGCTNSYMNIPTIKNLQENCQKSQDQLMEIQKLLSDVQLKTPRVGNEPNEDDPVDDKWMESLMEVYNIHQN